MPAEHSLCATDPTVSAVLLRVLAEQVSQHGVTPGKLLPRPAARRLAEDPIRSRLTLSEYRALLERAIRLTGEPALGLHLPLRASESSFDLIAPLVSHVPTLRDGLQEVRQFLPLAMDNTYLHLSQRAGVAQLRCEFPRAYDETDRTLAEFIAAGLVRMLRAFTSDPSALHAAHFEHRRPAYHHAYAAAFGGAERFEARFTGIEFASALLDRPHLHSNPALQRLVHAQAEQCMASLQRPETVVDRLQVYLLNQSGSCVCDMGTAARDLAVSVRSLRRRLAEQGMSYRGLAQQAQAERACAMLRNPDLTYQGIASALGFTDQASFHRAFKRWTGMTAGQYRSRH